MLNRSRPKRVPRAKSGFRQRKIAEQSPSNRRAIAEQSPSNRRSIAQETDAQPIAPETHSTSEIRLQATKKQSPSTRRATHKPALHEPLPLPRDSSKEESRQNNREDRTEKTEERRQNTREAESQYDCMIVMTVCCNDCMLVMTVRLNDCKTVGLNLEPSGSDTPSGLRPGEF